MSSMVPRPWGWGSVVAIAGLVTTAWLVSGSATPTTAAPPRTGAPIHPTAGALQRRLSSIEQRRLGSLDPPADWKATLRLISEIVGDDVGEDDDAGLDGEHVHYVANLLGWTGPTPTSSVMKTRKALQAWLPREYWEDAALLLENFGEKISPDYPNRGQLLRKCLRCEQPRLVLDLIERCGVDVQAEIGKAKRERESERERERERERPSRHTHPQDTHTLKPHALKAHTLKAHTL